MKKPGKKLRGTDSPPKQKTAARGKSSQPPVKKSPASREELESANEELTTVNDEIAVRNAEVDRSIADLNNFQASAKMPMLLLTRDLAIRHFTPLAAKLFTLLATDVGRPLSNVAHHLDLPDGALEQLLWEVIDTVSAREREVRDKEGRWYSLRVHPYMTLDNKIDGVVLVLVDIDALKRSEQKITQARDYAEAILQTTQYPLVVLTKDLRVRTANTAFYKIFTVLPGETEGRSIYAIGNGQWNIPSLRELLEDILPRNSFFNDFEVTHDFESVGRRTMLLNARRLLTDEEDAPERILLAIDDITERKQLEENKQKQLEENKQLLVREHAAREEAEAANRAKDDFLAMVSHELRTPLTPILGWCTMLRSRSLSDDNFDRALQSIERNAKVQVQLIEDILDVSRASTGKLSLDVRPVDLTQVIDVAIDTIRPAADAKTIQIQTHCDAGVGLVSGDPGRLQQVVLNLLSNAVKFTPNGGRVDIRLDRLDSDVQLTVSDTGKGFNADFLPLIFDRFRQADSTSTRKYGGLGLGLAIARQIIEMHGGTVHAESGGEGQGATFTVRFPIRGIGGKEDTAPGGSIVFPAVAPVTPFVCPPQLFGVRILLVDDQPDTLEMLRVVLEQQCRADVRISVNAAAALEVFQQWNPDVLVSDIALPGEDGYALIAKVRARQQGGKRTPAIALTAYVRRVEDRAHALQAGFDMFLHKPIEPSELLATLASLVTELRQSPEGTTI